MVNILSHCNSFLVLNSDIQIIKKDSVVKVLPINWLFFTNSKRDILTQ
jgi:molybdopterin molybdotransferase